MLDVVVVGAGISGIAAAYHLQTRCPGKSYAILEARDSLGGTWDLFRYPGVRSDSDMHTLGFAFRPWEGEASLADGASILEYLHQTAREFGIDRKIRYRHAVERARWSSREQCWTLDVRRGNEHELVQIRCRFLFGCAGYYDYEQGHAPQFPGQEQFRGRIVHPQFWTDDIDYAQKRVVVIGSGATAVTLVPALTDKAEHVTMLQRSPTYVASVPSRDAVAATLSRWLPRRAAFQLTRWKNMVLSRAFYRYCRRFPERARRFIIEQAEKRLGGAVDVDPHFSPRYRPWDQRVCAVPDGDLFRVLRDGRASVVTGDIDAFVEDGIRLRSGEHVPADLVVTATGLKLKFMGGIALEVDGTAIVPNSHLLHRGIMMSGVPNLAIAVGYTNASWTLKCTLTAEYVCRLLNYMDRKGYAACTPRTETGGVETRPLVDLTSGYVERAHGLFPQQGATVPWRLRQNYALDLVELRLARLSDPTLEFSAPAAEPAAHPSPLEAIA